MASHTWRFSPTEGRSINVSIPTFSKIFLFPIPIRKMCEVEYISKRKTYRITPKFAVIGKLQRPKSLLVLHSQCSSLTPTWIGRLSPASGWYLCRASGVFWLPKKGGLSTGQHISTPLDVYLSIHQYMEIILLHGTTIVSRGGIRTSSHRPVYGCACVAYAGSAAIVLEIICCWTEDMQWKDRWPTGSALLPIPIALILSM